MELHDLALTKSKKSAEIQKIMSGMILDRDTLERVRDVFREEIKLGLQSGLEKVTVILIRDMRLIALIVCSPASRWRRPMSLNSSQGLSQGGSWPWILEAQTSGKFQVYPMSF